jgi:uncharacterized protein
MRAAISRHFSHRAVRDLHWALFSPALATGSGFVDQLPGLSPVEALPWLSALDAQPEDLVQFLQQRKGQRLGRYFEALFSFFLRHHPRFELLGENLPVRLGKQTLGELDFIYRDRETGRVYHLEVAVKFYLGFPHKAPACWLGPNPRDRLMRKLDWMETHQKTLFRHPAAAPLRESLAIGAFEDRLLVKGRLYGPGNPSGDLPPAVSPEGLRGEWYEASAARFQLGEGLWLRLPKPYWLAEPNAVDAAYLAKQGATFRPGSDEVPHPLHLWKEGRYVFLVPATWPVTAC